MANSLLLLHNLLNLLITTFNIVWSISTGGKYSVNYQVISHHITTFRTDLDVIYHIYEFDMSLSCLTYMIYILVCR
jgi:hypothetical protein